MIPKELLEKTLYILGWCAVSFKTLFLPLSVVDVFVFFLIIYQMLLINSSTSL